MSVCPNNSLMPFMHCSYFNRRLDKENGTVPFFTSFLVENW